MAILGIDLGTTYSVGAYLTEDGIPKIISNKEGDDTTPSIVLFESDNNIVVGRIAKDSIIVRPREVVADAKNFMGKNKVLFEQNGRKYTPEMISSFVLRKIIADAKSALNEEIEGVVITVPAYFTDAGRKATTDAATMTGVPLLGMINEPTAAALCYVNDKKIADENIMIYDLGGGTFDVTILHITDEKKIDVLSTDGLSNAGGRFLDQSIVDYVTRYIDREYDIDLEDEEYLDELQELNIKAENAKIQLSNMTSVTIPVKVDKVRERIEITRDTFEKMVDKIYQRTEVKMKAALDSAGLTKRDISRVLMVGGSSRIPYIARKVEEFMGIKPSCDINPDEAVAMGAAIYSKFCESETATFTDVCSHSIGIVVLNHGMEENDIIIPKNSRLPISIEQRFRTAAANQKRIDLTITEGEYKEVTDVTIIGNFQINLPDNVAEKSLVLISISLDKSQLIHIHVKLPDYNCDEEYHMKRIANMDEETVAEVTGLLMDYQVN